MANIVFTAKRFAIIGCGGTGKSTLARELGEITGIQVIHLDKLYWQPGWRERDEQEWNGILDSIVDRDSWIIDGNYGATFQRRFLTADAVVFLDFPRWLSLLRVIKRRWMYRGRTRPDMAEGCPEKVDVEFLNWIWRFPKRGRLKILNAVEKLSVEDKVVTLTSPSAVKQFLSQWRSSNGIVR